MPAPARFHVTYDVTTPESAAHGDTAESGFVTPTGRFDMAGYWGLKAGKAKAVCALTLRDAVQAFGHGYGSGTLDSSNGRAMYQPESSVTDYKTGESERLAFHPPDNVTPSSFHRLLRLLEL